MTGAFRIRPFDRADEDDLVRVWLASTIPGQSFLSEEYWRSMEPVVREKFVPVADTWIVEEGGEMRAFMSLLGNLIGGLFTHPEHQGRGYGRALVEHARGRFDDVLVEVFVDNAAAVRFYEGRGFLPHERKVDEQTGLSVAILRVPGL